MADPGTAAAGAVDAVVGRLEAIEESLPAADGVACFNRMYLTVTRLVRDRLAAGHFADPAAMQALDVTFADLYLAAVDADVSGGVVPSAWAPLFARRADTGVSPLQFAVAGMNAHVNHDLPVAVVATCTAIGTSPDTGSFRDDYLKVNQVLADVHREVRESFLAAAVVEAGRDLAPVLDLVGTWSVDRARDAAWVNAEVLWRFRELHLVRDAFRDTLAETVGLVTATLLSPVLPA